MRDLTGVGSGDLAGWGWDLAGIGRGDLAGWGWDLAGIGSGDLAGWGRNVAGVLGDRCRLNTVGGRFNGLSSLVLLRIAWRECKIESSISELDDRSALG